MASKLNIKIVSWNVECLPPPENLDLHKLFHTSGNLTDADIIAIGLQEINFKINNEMFDMVIKIEPWSVMIAKFLIQKDYEQLLCGWTSKPDSLGLTLLIFVKRNLTPYIAKIESKFLKTGFTPTSRKGTACVRLTLCDGTFIVLINTHLEMGLPNLPARIKAYNMILADLESLNFISKDYVFWFGDLNFRVENFTFDEAMHLINANEFESLLEFDQLRICVKSKVAFNDYQEGPINFKPTYKFVTGTSSYESKREPSWCDRILFSTKDNHRELNRKLSCELINYDSISSFTNSDHKPVTAMFSLKVYNDDSEDLIKFSDNNCDKKFMPL